MEAIIPPKLEDAGLEDCALPFHSIQEAFLKAASAVGSRATDEDGGCVADSSSHAPSDVLVGVTPERDPPSGPCTAVKGGALVGDAGMASEDLVVGVERKNDDVVVIGGVVGGGGECGGCVDGIRDLDIKERENGGCGGDGGDGGEDEKKKPSLVEGYFLNP